ncbi:organic solvent ABC transporter substrate-binding protein [Azoarcus sp. DD4]|nr:MlaD family protein [Azoarcus sp. DD4]QDF97166.1 organic solvent ABC transporter substrate-binding protein [Azoarcus sp. DD4]
MESRAHAFAAGLFALLLGSGLVLALWWFSDGRVPMREYVLVSEGTINGLNVQARVRYRGMLAGNVTHIGIDPNDPRLILVRIRIREGLPVTRGTRATLGTQGVTGLAYVQLDDRGADPEPLDSADGSPPRIRLEPGLMDQITDRALAAAERFKTVADKIAVLFDDENAARLKRALANLESATAGIDRTFGDAPGTLAAISAAFSPQNVARLSATLANLERGSGEAAPTVAEARILMTRLGELSVKLDRAATLAGDDLVGTTIPQLNDMLHELTTTSRRLGRLIEDIEHSPQLLLTGRGEHAPGPGEDGFAADAP